MSKTEEIKTKLENQTQMILDGLFSVEFLINYHRYYDEMNFKQTQGYVFMYNVVKSSAIINAFKIFHHQEDYSFDNLKRLVLEEKGRENQETKEFLKSLNKAKGLYSELNIYEIRNKHVGHLDREREKVTISWNKLKTLFEYGGALHDQLNLMLFKTQTAWTIDSGMLNEIFSKDLRSRLLFDLRRKIFREDISKVNRQEIIELSNTHWP